jgi:hypothetical protein
MHTGGGRREEGGGGPALPDFFHNPKYPHQKNLKMTVHLCLVFHGQPPGALRNLKQIMKPVLILLKVEKQKGKGFHTKFCSPKGSRADKKVEHERH